jgi:hypothetical protein
MNRLPIGQLILTVFLLILAIYVNVQSYNDTKAKSPPVVTCEPWAETKQWTLDRCHDENDEIVCMVFSSGMGQCKFKE